MLYKPKFCSECGEKIVRTDRAWFWSFQFCDLCRTENQLTHFGTWAAIAFVPIFVLGSITYSILPGKPAETYKSVSPPTSAAQLKTSQARVPGPNSTDAPATETKDGPETKGPLEALPFANNSASANQKRAVTEEQIFACGVRTKKGTPCSRRVKTPGPCWQHRDIAE